MAENNDVYLAGKAAGGDVLAFETLIIKYEKSIYNIALRMVNSPEDAKDIAQNVLIKLYTNISKFKGDSQFSTWLYRITVNTCIDEIRKLKRKNEVSIDDGETGVGRGIIDGDQTPEESLVSKEGYNEVLKTLSTMSEEYKTVIILRDIRGLSYAEIVDITECSLGTVKSRISRGRLKLKELLLKKGELTDKNGRITYRKGGK